jgi:hypothetical protein
MIPDWTDQRDQCILFSVVFTSPTSATTAVFGLPAIACAGLPIHMIGMVSWEPKRR